MLDERGVRAPEIRRLEQEELLRGDGGGRIHGKSLGNVADFDAIAPLDGSGMREQAEQGAEEDGLPGAVRSKHREGFSLLQSERNVVQDLSAIQRHAEPFDFQYGFLAHESTSS